MASVDEPDSKWVNAVRYCRWPDCEQKRNDDPEGPPLCMNHVIRTARYFAAIYGRTVLDPQREAQVELLALTAGQPSAQVVYYVRLGDHVKIGTTGDIGKRLSGLYVDHDPDALLATEPGGYDLEKQRHLQFAAERVYANRELFNPSRRLLAHIETLKDRDQAA